MKKLTQVTATVFLSLFSLFVAPSLSIASECGPVQFTVNLRPDIKGDGHCKNIVRAEISDSNGTLLYIEEFAAWKGTQGLDFCHKGIAFVTLGVDPAMRPDWTSLFGENPPEETPTLTLFSMNGKNQEMLSSGPYPANAFPQDCMAVDLAALEADLMAVFESRLQEGLDALRSSLHAHIHTELAANSAEDQAYTEGRLGSEAATRAAADAGLQNHISVEASTRAAADAELQAALDAESAARANADGSLNYKIDTISLTPGPAGPPGPYGPIGPMGPPGPAGGVSQTTFDAGVSYLQGLIFTVDEKLSHRVGAMECFLIRSLEYIPPAPDGMTSDACDEFFPLPLP